MTKLEQLAKLICPDVTLTIKDLEEKYQPRNLAEGTRVTRFAPSPTGFLHTGSLFASFVAAKLAHDTNGIFYLRIEDTDTKREVKGSTETLINQLALFKVKIDEGYIEYCSEKAIIAAQTQIEEEILQEDPEGNCLQSQCF